MSMTFGDYTLNLVDARRIVKATRWDVVTVIVFDEETKPVDRFDMYCPFPGSVWYAWTADTFSQTRVQRRDNIAAWFNRQRATA